jgi:glycine/D-amino acid oxidase-like deaminating enzyme
MNQSLQYDAVVIGGGFFGCTISLYLKNYLKKVLLLEKESDLLQRASYVNQARVHNGYHYPRSILTALRSRINFPLFCQEYQDCIVTSFDNYYAVSKMFSKIDSSQFKTFCDRIGTPIQIASSSIKKLFNKNLVEEVFFTQEYVFDSVKLKQRMYRELAEKNIETHLKSEVTQLKHIRDLEGIQVTTNSDSGKAIITTKYVFNCTYSGINTILSASHLPTISLKHELAEIALVKVPKTINGLGITILCGNFFSIVPFPPRDLYTLSHVRYTPHSSWQDTENLASPINHIYHQAVRKTNYPYMIRDAKRYMPILEDCSYVDSIWDIKTILPQSEIDDSRPILCQKNHGLPNLTCILGAKIDNIFDIFDELQDLNLHEYS